MFPLKFEEALTYVIAQLEDGHTLAKKILRHLDFNQGNFFALIHSSANKTKIHEFKSGGILELNPLEQVAFQGHLYSGRKKSHSVGQLSQYLKHALKPQEFCLFEDLIHHHSDPIAPDIKEHIFYIEEELYLYLTENEFSETIAKKIIEFVNAQWYYMNIISNSGFDLKQTITAEQLEKIAMQTTVLVIGAYDMEGFVLWEKWS